MASVDIQAFIEDRLLALDPSMDLSAGSPAQTKLIAPLLSHLGTDPFETDIDVFLTDRFAQEFPDIYASDPGAIRDTFVNPLKLILEPWKRETQSIKRSQSLIDPTALSDDDADALVANIFDSRDQGGYAVGVGRLYFQNPTDVRIEMGHRGFSSSGLSFFPTNPVTVSAETMAFNRDGTLFYLDVPMRAEAAGDEYNLDSGQLAGFDGAANVVKVTNLRRFVGGAARQDTTSFVQAAEQSLTERSLSTRRGAAARLANVFKGTLRAVQVIGAKDPEMQRDLLVALSPGHAWITGRVELYNQVAYVRARTFEGTETDVPQVGDTLYIYLDRVGFQAVADYSRFVRLRVEEVYFSQRQAAGDYQFAYFVRWSDPSLVLRSLFGATAYQAFLSSMPVSMEGGFAKKGLVKISSVPDIDSVDAEVLNGKVHLFGRTDIYVRPSTQDVSQTVINGVYDLGKTGSTPRNPHFSLEQLSLSTASGSNAVTDTEAGFDFSTAGVSIGDFLSIEDGPDAGLYTIRDLAGNTAFLSQQLTASKISTRYRVLKKLRINPFEARIIRFPFGDVLQADLQTTIGSKLITLGQTDLLQYGARAGDTLRILTGPDKGDYTISSFDPVLGGQGVFLDRSLTSTNFALTFEVFTPQDSVQRPLVRTREILLLDSAKQSTGITVPPADAVAVVPTGPLTSARVLGVSQLSSGYVLPDLAGIIDGYVSTAATAVGVSDRRYSMGFDQPDGVYLPMEFPDGTHAELDFRSDSKGKASYFLATTEVFADSVNTPPVEPQPGESLSIKNGPNKGSYLIRAVHKFKYKAAADKTAYVYFIQIYGSFPVDPLKQIIEFISVHGTTGLSGLALPIQFPSFFSTWYAGLGTSLASALSSSGSGIAAPTAEELQATIEAMNACYYECGTPARGVLRSYFREPTLFEQKTGEAASPTVYQFFTSSGELIKYRPDPLRYTQQEIIPARVSEDADPKNYPRDLDASTGDPTFLDQSRLSIFAAGVGLEDTLSVHEERFVYTTKLQQAVVATTAGTQQISARPSAGTVFTASMVGDLIFLEEGDDKGGYRITRYLDPYNVLVDRVLGATTDLILKDGQAATYGFRNGKNEVHSNVGRPFTAADVGSYLALYGIDYRQMGSFMVEELLDVDGFGNASSIAVSTATDFLAYPQETSQAKWAVVTSSKSPTAMQRQASFSGSGQEFIGVVPIRIYESETSNYSFVSIIHDSATSGGTVSGTPKDGVSQPYRIYRPNVRRVTPSEMDANRDGFLCYFDTEVVSLAPNAASNIPVDTYLKPLDGTFESSGYRHAVADPNFTYSMQEEGFLDLPLTVLPVGSPDSPDSLVRVVGSPIQISYERTDLIELIQNFIDSPSDRVLSAGLLARHFLPAYISYDAMYEGGQAAADVAKAIRAHVDSTPVETAVDVSEIEKIITQRGGNPITPTKISATIYDLDRRMWVEFSENQLGGALPADTKVTYNGSPRVCYFVPGPDVSDLTTVPAGERVKLTRR
jgi:hypothetical protein